MTTTNLATALRAGVRPYTREAAAIVGEVCNQLARAGGRSRAPSLDDISLEPGGRLTIAASSQSGEPDAPAPASGDVMAGLAALVEAVLPPLGSEGPYSVAASFRILPPRARRKPGLVPIDSPAALAAEVARFEMADRTAVLRTLSERVARALGSNARGRAVSRSVAPPASMSASSPAAPASTATTSSPARSSASSSANGPGEAVPRRSPVEPAAAAHPSTAVPLDGCLRAPGRDGPTDVEPAGEFLLHPTRTLRVQDADTKELLASVGGGSAGRWRAARVVAAGTGLLLLLFAGGLGARWVLGENDQGDRPEVTRGAAPTTLDSRPLPQTSEVPPVALAAPMALGTSGTAGAQPETALVPSDLDNATRAPQPVPLDTSPIGGPAFSPSFTSDGRELVFHVGREPSARLASASLTEGSRARTVSTLVDDRIRTYHPRVSPDGELVAFDSDRDGERAVYVSRRDGSALRRVSSGGPAAQPSWSPDMKWLAFGREEVGRPRVWNLWMRDMRTGEMHRLTSHRYGQTWNASWFPDSRRVCYSHEDRLVVFDTVRRTARVFSSPLPGRIVRTPAVSPDGERVIFQVSRDGAWLLDVRSGAMRRVIEDPGAEEFAWDPEGRRIAYHSGRGGSSRIWIVSAADL